MPLNSLVLWAFLTLPFKGPLLPWGCHWLISMPVALKWYPPHTHHLLLHIPPRAVSRFEAYLHWGFSFQLLKCFELPLSSFSPWHVANSLSACLKGGDFPSFWSPFPSSRKLQELQLVCAGIFFLTLINCP